MRRPRAAGGRAPAPIGAAAGGPNRPRGAPGRRRGAGPGRRGRRPPPSIADEASLGAADPSYRPISSRLRVAIPMPHGCACSCASSSSQARTSRASSSRPTQHQRLDQVGSHREHPRVAHAARDGVVEHPAQQVDRWLGLAGQERGRPEHPARLELVPGVAEGRGDAPASARPTRERPARPPSTPRSAPGAAPRPGSPGRPGRGPGTTPAARAPPRSGRCGPVPRRGRPGG